LKNKVSSFLTNSNLNTSTRARARVCVCVYAHACVRACVCVFNGKKEDSRRTQLDRYRDISDWSCHYLTWIGLFFFRLWWTPSKSGLRKDRRRWHGGMSCLLEGGKNFIARLITDEEFYLLGAMIHEFFAKDVEEYEPFSILSFRPASSPFSFLYFVKISWTYCAWFSSCFTYVYVRILNVLCTFLL